LPLFLEKSPVRPVSAPLDEGSELLLARFREIRAGTGAHPRSIAREVSQLRSLAREAGRGSTPLPLVDLFHDLNALARVLCEPSLPISRSTGRVRLIATQRFIAATSPIFGRDAGTDLARLDALLPARPRTGWHDAGTLVAGTRTRRHRRAPTLSPFDLLRILEFVPSDGEAFRAVRNCALVALHCFSGLRAEEIAALHWEGIEHQVVDGAIEIAAWVERDSRRVRLPIPGPAAAAMTAYENLMHDRAGACVGAVFRRDLSNPRPLGYRAVRDVVVRACREAGYGPVASVELRAAFAAWLRSRGLSDHEVAEVLGVARVRSVDRLLARHVALAAQRAVREQLG